MLLILTSTITSRLRYSASLLLRELLGVEFEITNSPEDYAGHGGPKFTYAREPLDGELFIEASGLLFENVLYPHELRTTRVNGIPVLFQSADPRSALPFDPFACAFYMVSRYEEYHSHKKDKYGRFQVKESIAFTGGFLEEPVVHRWAEALGSLLQRQFPGLVLKRPAYRFVPTIDIDHAYAYRHRPLLRTIAGMGRSLLHGHVFDALNRTRVLLGGAHDPYDTYTYIRGVHQPASPDPLWFYLFADYGGDDNNISTSGRAARALLKELDSFNGVGIHPSLSSNKHYLKLEAEYNGLCDLLDRDVTISRQHFLKISLPKTYRTLMQIGILHDYSMGYSSHLGFRAGIAIPYHFFDLAKNDETGLTIHPVSIMDVTLKDHLRLSRESSLEAIAGMVDKIKSVNGEFVSLWHNESLGDTGRWKGWRVVYEEMLRLAAV